LINRRDICRGAAAMALVAGSGIYGLPPMPAWADDTVSTAELMKPGALPDMVMGSDKAPVTIVEYASMTCPHCAHFQDTTFPELKKRYIDTGKVRYIFREFPLDTLASAAFMLARCAGEKDQSKYFAMVDTLFRQQTQWITAKPVPPLLAIAKQAGFTEQSFDACLANQKLLDGIQDVRQRAIDTFKVQSTPTFFINGAKYAGAMSIEEMAKLIDPQLKGG
jgi:protein-disulfide isomerase